MKIIETVLKGVNGSPSPVKGLLDAAADRELEMVILKIERSSDAKRIAYEAKENLRLVGYDANPGFVAAGDEDLVVDRSYIVEGEAGEPRKKNCYRQIFLRSNDFTEWIFTFLPTFQTISKKGWVETLFFSFDQFSYKVSTTTISFRNCPES